MKFTITKNLFFKTLSHLQSIVDKKNSLPILSNILIEASENKGSAMKKREEVHRMAEANKAFSHFRF